MKYFKQSIRIVNSYLIFIPFLASGWGYIESKSTGILKLLMFLLVLLSFILYPIVYGSLVETMTNRPKNTWCNLLRVYWFNLLAWGLLLLIPFIVILMIFRMISHNMLVAGYINSVLFSCLLIYTLPLVFLKQRVLSSISTGINILFRTLYRSLPLILMSILPYTLIFLIESQIIYNYHLSNILTNIIIYLLTLILVYVNILVFTMATMILIEQGHEINATITNNTY